MRENMEHVTVRMSRSASGDDEQDVLRRPGERVITRKCVLRLDIMWQLDIEHVHSFIHPGLVVITLFLDTLTRPPAMDRPASQHAVR